MKAIAEASRRAELRAKAKEAETLRYLFFPSLLLFLFFSSLFFFLFLLTLSDMQKHFTSNSKRESRARTWR